MDSCAVCTEMFNKRTRMPIVCSQCHYTACRTCVESFLTVSTIEPKCMSCNTRWDMEFLRQSMTTVFMKTEYKAHQTKSQIAQAEAMLPGLQAAAKRQERCEKLEEQIKKIKEGRKELTDLLIQANSQLWRLKHGGGGEVVSTATTNHLPCPKGDCHGSLGAGHKCMMCETKYCSRCMKETAEGHECNKDDVETVRLLTHNTKQCPKCRVGISKTEGCDQMWCTACHTCFSWRTGQILNGTIHNPHYYEFLRSGRNAEAVVQRNVGDIPCGGMPNVRQVIAITNDAQVLSLHREINHIIEVKMPEVHRRAREKTASDAKSGIMYLLKRIERESWIASLFRSTRQEEMNHRFYMLLEALAFSGSDLFRKFCQDHDKAELIEGVKQVFGCFNEGVDKYNREFSVRRPHMTVG